MASTVAKAVTRADNRKLGGDLRKTRSMFQRSFGGIGKGIKGALSGALSPLGIGVGALGFAAIGKEVLDFEQTLTDLEIQAGASKKDMTGLRSTIDSLSSTTAIGKESLAALALEMVNLEGTAGLNAKKLEVLAEAAFATSAPVEELAGLSLSLANSFNLIKPDDLRKGLDGIVKAGKEGSVPLAEMNLLLQQNGAQFSKFAGEGVASVSLMASTLQGLRKDFGSAGEAGTALGAIMAIFQTREVQLRKAGVEVRKTNGDFKEISKIALSDEMTKLISKASKFNKAFGTRKEGRLALDSLRKRAGFIEEITAATVNSNSIAEDAARRRTRQSFKIKKAFNDIKISITEAFTPDRIRSFAKLIAKIGDVLGFMLNNAKLFIGIWATLKLSSIISGFQAMAASSAATAMSTAATAASTAATRSTVGRLTTSVGSLGIAAGVVGAAFAGWEIGRVISQVFELDRRISDLALPSAQEEKFFGTGNVRELAGIVGEEQQRGRAGKAARTLGLDIGGIDQQRAGSRALRLAGAAREKGIIGPGGKVDRAAAFEAQTGKTALGIPGTKQFEDILKAAGTDAFIKILQQSEAISQVTKQAREQKLDVRISIDEGGGIVAKLVEDQNARRAPQ